MQVLAKGIPQSIFVSLPLSVDSPPVNSRCSQSPIIARKSLPIAVQSFHIAWRSAASGGCLPTVCVLRDPVKSNMLAIPSRNGFPGRLLRRLRRRMRSLVCVPMRCSLLEFPQVGHHKSKVCILLYLNSMPSLTMTRACLVDGLDRGLTPFAGADTDDLLDGLHEYLAVAYLAGAGHNYYHV